MCENASYLVTFSTSSEIVLFCIISLFRGENKGNKVASIYQRALLFSLQPMLSVLLTRLIERKVEGGEL
jgi:hypothetical protein